MAKLEECVRSVECDGLLWGACEYLGFLELFFNNLKLMSLILF